MVGTERCARAAKAKCNRIQMNGRSRCFYFVFAYSFARRSRPENVFFPFSCVLRAYLRRLCKVTPSLSLSPWPVFVPLPSSLRVRLVSCARRSLDALAEQNISHCSPLARVCVRSEQKTESQKEERERQPDFRQSKHRTVFARGPAFRVAEPELGLAFAPRANSVRCNGALVLLKLSDSAAERIRRETRSPLEGTSQRERRVCFSH